MTTTLSLKKRLTPFIIPLALLFLSAPPLHSAEEKQDAATCVKRPFKEVKTVTPFSLTHRPQSKKMMYDDIMCGLKWRDKQCSSGQGNFDGGALVYDFNTLAEIPISEATFVQSKAIASPMGSGVAAFASPAAADAFLAANGEGKKLTYQELLLLVSK